MKSTSPPKLAHQMPLPDPYDDKVPPLTLPIAYLAVGSHVASQPRILSRLHPSRENNSSSLCITPQISQRLHTMDPTSPRLVALADPEIEAAIPPLQLPVSQASITHRLMSMLRGMMYLSGRPELTTPPPEE